MKNISKTFFLFLFGGTVFLSFCWYDNNLGVVEPGYYELWEKTYERVVIGRLAKSQQDGILSAGGLLGLANTLEGWNFDIHPQYVVYETGAKVEHFLPYKSNPGFQGIVFSTFDALTNFPPQQNIAIIRLATTLLSAFTISFLCACLYIEFGWLSAVFVILFSAHSEWMILPAVNSYWNLWAFYLPLITCILLIMRTSTNNLFTFRKVYIILFLMTLIKILFTGFEMITTVLIMTTVPFVYFSITKKWGWKILIKRLLLLGLVSISAVILGLGVLAGQIAASDGSLSGSIEYISSTFGRRASTSADKYASGPYAESKEVSVFKVLRIYLDTNAFNSQTQPEFWQIRYWQIIVLFAIASLVFIVRYYLQLRSPRAQHGAALVLSTWYSVLAPISWYVIFKPTSYIHTFLFPMAWQMPFTLLGFALCGFVIADLFQRTTN